jgi:hypothetical protein
VVDERQRLAGREAAEVVVPLPRVVARVVGEARVAGPREGVERAASGRLRVRARRAERRHAERGERGGGEAARGGARAAGGAEGEAHAAARRS